MKRYNSIPHVKTRVANPKKCTLEMLEVVRCCTHWFEFQTASLCSTHSLITMHFVVPVVIHHDKLSFTVLRKQQLLMCVEYIFRITKQEATSGWTFWENGLRARGKLWSALWWSKLNIAESSYLAASGCTDILNVLACKHHRFALIRFVSTCILTSHVLFWIWATIKLTTA